MPRRASRESLARQLSHLEKGLKHQVHRHRRRASPSQTPLWCFGEVVNRDTGKLVPYDRLREPQEPGSFDAEEHSSCQHVIPGPKSAHRVMSQC